MSDIDPADVTLTGGRAHPEKFPQDLTDLSDSPAGLKKQEREGLPTGYRMRADAHYVEQLTARRADRAEHARPTPRDADVHETEHPNDRREVRDRRSDKVLAQLTEDIATIESAVAMVASETSTVARRTGLDLIRAHSARAAWALRANGMLDGGARGHLRPRQLAFIMGQVRQALAAECRLAGVTLQVHVTDWNAVVPVDEAALTTGLVGAVFATLGLITPNEGAVVKVSVDAGNGELRSVEVSQDDVTVTTSMTGRFYDPTWVDRPGGWVATLGAASAKAAVQAHNGTASFVVGDRRGTTIRMQLSRSV